MTQKELIQQIQGKIVSEEPVKKEVIDQVLTAYSAVIKETLVKDEQIVLPDLGRLHVIKKSSRKGRNPRTGEEITIPARNAVKFEAYRALKDAVNS